MRTEVCRWTSQACNSTCKWYVYCIHVIVLAVSVQSFHWILKRVQGLSGGGWPLKHDWHLSWPGSPVECKISEEQLFDAFQSPQLRYEKGKKDRYPLHVLELLTGSECSKLRVLWGHKGPCPTTWQVAPHWAHDLVSEASDSLSAFRHHSPRRHWLPWAGDVLRRGGR